MQKIRRWVNFLNEKLSFLEGKPISLVKTLHTTGKWNQKTNKMDDVKKSEDVNGFITNIGEHEGFKIVGFSLTDGNGKKRGLIMYDKKIKEFVEGDSIFHYTYTGKTDKDNRILQLILDNLL